MSAAYEAVGFTGFGREIFCATINWNNLLFQVKEKYHDKKDRTWTKIAAQEWLDNSTYIWNWFPGLLRTNIDLIVLAI